LARAVRASHEELMEDDPVVLPNGRVFGRERLRMLNEKLGTRKGKAGVIRRIAVGQEWSELEMKKKCSFIAKQSL